MSGFISSAANNTKCKSPEYRKALLSDLLNVIKDCHLRYGGKTELATENDQRIVKLCDCWEAVLCHGLVSSTNSSMSTVLKNVTDMVTSAPVELPNFWEFAFAQMRSHERERFSTLRHVWTDRGKTRALIRACLNERSLETHVMTWLGDIAVLNKSYEPWAFLRDAEASHMLPSMAAGLSAILFAITIDSPDLNLAKLLKESRPEPIVAAPAPPEATPRKPRPVNRQIIDFDNDGRAVTPPSEKLSALCLKQDDDKVAATSPPPRPSIAQVYNIEEELPSIVHNVVCSPPARVEVLPPLVDPPRRTFMEDYPTATPIDSELVNNTPSKSPPPEPPSSSKHSSVHSSTLSLSSGTEDVERLKKRLLEAEERCQWLESRVAELSLENHRLKGISNSPRGGMTYFTVSVPRVYLQKDGGRKFYVYEIHIIPTYGGDEWTIRRRYNEFYKLHMTFQKSNPGVKALDFPPKKNFGNMDACFVEQRRQRLQVYLRHLLAILPEMSTCTTRFQLEEVFPFFR